ncbi:protein phosphatase 1 regulatory subunit 12B-like [Lampris incognitus]|uniref:protein phosphatase 1 regulatory subunit 12B-like n=1 Tax=Lampris incognitus TaxID=2546036 RepID=UPI0024B61BE7|nr:protein phosphatase 1 regulatory subunit 12B-like [Lampris incognitus]
MNNSTAPCSGQQLAEMSSSFSRSKDQQRSRKFLSDYSTTSPIPTTNSLRHDRVSRLNSERSGTDVSKDRTLSQTESYISQRENRSSMRKKAEEEMGCNDYKKMYEEAMNMNQRLKSRLETSKQELVMVQAQLEKIVKRRGRPSDCSSNLLETEKKERQALEKKISDMEEELKVKAKLKMENRRLKDENGALIRVISKLPK